MSDAAAPPLRLEGVERRYRTEAGELPVLRGADLEVRRAKPAGERGGRFGAIVGRFGIAGFVTGVGAGRSSSSPSGVDVTIGVAAVGRPMLLRDGGT